MRVIITGGSGLIGRELARSLINHKDQVWILSRSQSGGQDESGAQRAAWDGKTSQGWQHLANEADVIINLAGENIGAGRWTPERKKLILESRLQAGQAVVQAVKAAKHRPNLVIQSSAVGYYGASGDRIILENDLCGDDYLASVARRWEDSTRPVEDMQVRRVLIRTGVVLSKQGGVLNRLLLPFRLFVGGPVGSGRQWLPWIHMEDEVRAIDFLMRQAAAEGAYNLCAPNPLTNADFGKVLARYSRRPYWAPAPAFALRIALGEMSTLVLDGQRVIPDRLLKMGFQFLYPDAATALSSLLS